MTITRKPSTGFYKLCFLLIGIYAASYITRINFGAVISEIITAEGYSRSATSLAVTGSFITYGVGQIISGFFGDRIQPRFLITAGLVVTTVINLIIPICGNPYLMSAFWCINGFAQAFMWPPILKLMVTKFTETEYTKASVLVSFGSSTGTIVIYLIAPLLIHLISWKAVFVFSAVCGAALAVTCFLRCPDIELVPTVKKKEESSAGGSFVTPVLIFIMIGIVLQGMLRDGVTTWMPSYISETFSLGNAVSILTGVVLPLFSIGCFQITANVYGRFMKNELVCAGTVFGVGAVSAAVLMFCSGNSAFLSVLLSAVLTGAMHGVNLMLICIVPKHFKKYGKVSLISGILNSCTYVGSALSTYGMAVFSEHFGWHKTIMLWAFIALGGTVICLGAAKSWKKFTER